MLKTVGPHDLKSDCADCGTTLSQVAQETGITEETLLAFAAGQIGLSANARLSILEALNRNVPPRDMALDTQLTNPLPIPDEVMHDLIMGVGNRLVTELAYNRLQREAAEEIVNATH